MIEAGQGLTRITTEDLKRLLRALHHGDLRTPLAIDELTRFGLQDVAADLLALLRSLDEKAIRAVLVAVLAERLGQDSASIAS